MTHAEGQTLLETTAQIVNGELVIRLRTSTLANAAKYSPYFDGCAAHGTTLRITDEAAFARSVSSALNSEREDGSTPITRMLDKAFQHAAEQGLDGIEFA